MDGRLILHRRLYLVLSLGSDFLRVVFLFLAVMIYCGIGFAGDHRDVRVEIIAAPNPGKAPMCVHFEAKIGGLEEPIKLEWSFGDGQESTKMAPPPHYYAGGKYNVVLEVIDRTGKKYTAGITVDAALSSA